MESLYILTCHSPQRVWLTEQHVQIQVIIKVAKSPSKESVAHLAFVGSGVRILNVASFKGRFSQNQKGKFPIQTVQHRVQTKFSIFIICLVLIEEI